MSLVDVDADALAVNRVSVASVSASIRPNSVSHPECSCTPKRMTHWPFSSSDFAVPRLCARMNWPKVNVGRDGSPMTSGVASLSNATRACSPVFGPSVSSCSTECWNRGPSLVKVAIRAARVIICCQCFHAVVSLGVLTRYGSKLPYDLPR